MNREKIEMSDIYEEGEDKPWDGLNSSYKWIEDRELHYDADKNMIDIEVIFQRKSDGKYFKVTYTKYNYCGNSLHEETAVEVFPKTVQKVIYE